MKRDLDKITTLQFDAALAGKDFGLTKDGDLRLLANASKSRPEELLERQSDEYMSSYSAEQQISNSELLSIIQEEGF